MQGGHPDFVLSAHLQVIFQQNYQVTKWEYEELGPAAVHRKCMS